MVIERLSLIPPVDLQQHVFGIGESLTNFNTRIGEAGRCSEIPRLLEVESRASQAYRYLFNDVSHPHAP